MEVPPSHKLQNHTYYKENLFRLKEDKPSQQNFQSQLSHPCFFTENKNVRIV